MMNKKINSSRRKVETPDCRGNYFVEVTICDPKGAGSRSQFVTGSQKHRNPQFVGGGDIHEARIAT